METTTAVETSTYRVLLVRSGSCRIVVLKANQIDLPRVEIPRRVRSAQALREVIWNRWGLDVLILKNVTTEHSDSLCVTAEVLSESIPSILQEVSLDTVPASELSTTERDSVAATIMGQSDGPFSGLCWIDEAITWIGRVTGHNFSSKEHLQQLNAGAEFALLYVRSDNGQGYWLKATGKPNVHELSLVSCLSELFPRFLPKLVATRADWNAWLTEDSGKPLDEPAALMMAEVAASFAALQQKSTSSLQVISSVGAFDHRAPTLRDSVPDMFTYLMAAMKRQQSTAVEPVSTDRLLELGEMIQGACLRLEALNIPDALIHNDLSWGNILIDGANVVFTDWSEAAIGNPFLSCERLCQLRQPARNIIRAAYRKIWSQRLSCESVDRAFALVPILAIYAYLYGRGDCLTGESPSLDFEGHARSLARHMDRAARSPEFLEVLYASR